MIQTFVKWFRIRRYTHPGETIQLSDDERAELADLINHPVMQKALMVAETRRPSLFGDSDPSVRLATLQGWELHKYALLGLVSVPGIRKESVLMPTYPRGLYDEPKKQDQ